MAAYKDPERETKRKSRLAVSYIEPRYELRTPCRNTSLSKRPNILVEKEDFEKSSEKSTLPQTPPTKRVKKRKSITKSRKTKKKLSSTPSSTTPSTTPHNNDLSEPHHRMYLWQPEGDVPRDQSEFTELDSCLSVYHNISTDVYKSSCQPISGCLETHKRLTLDSVGSYMRQIHHYNTLTKSLEEKKEEHGLLLSSIKTLLNDISRVSKEYSSLKKHVSDKRQRELTKELNAIINK